MTSDDTPLPSLVPSDTNHAASNPARLRGRDVAVTAIGNIASLLSVVVGAPILAQSLGVEQRGVVAGAIAPLMLLLGAATLGVPEAATYYIANRSGAPRRIMARGSAIIVFVGVIASAAVFAIASPLAGGNPQLESLIKVAAAALPLALVTLILRAAAAGLHAWKLIAVERAIFGMVRLGGFTILLLLGRLDALSATIVMATSTFIGAIAYTGLLRRRTTSEKHGYHKVSLVRYGARFWVGSITGVVLTRLDQVLMIPLSTETQLGLYAVAVSVAEIPLVISMAVRDVTFSVEAESSSNARVTSAARITSVAVFVVAVGIVAVSQPLIPIVFGSEFTEAIPVIFILLAGTLFATAGSIGGMAVAARGRPGLRSAALALAAGVNVLLLFILLPGHGAVGAAIATMVGNLAYTVINVALCTRILGTRPRDFFGVRRNDCALVKAAAATLRRKARTKKGNHA